MSTLYTTKAKIEDYLLTDIDSSIDSAVDAYIAAMSTAIDEMVGYPVYRTDETTQTYDGNSRRELSIDPVHTITEITVDGAVALPTQAPYNDDVKTSLIFSGSYFPRDIANVTVTGVHSLKTALPADIAHAATVFTALIVTQLKEAREGVSSEKIGEYTVSFRTEKERLDYQMAKDIVMSYKRLSF